MVFSRIDFPQNAFEFAPILFAGHAKEHKRVVFFFLFFLTFCSPHYFAAICPAIEFGQLKAEEEPIFNFQIRTQRPPATLSVFKI